MTKEELERIKQAYNSGLKVQIWFNGYWENFDARDYSMYSEPFSENRQYRIVGNAYADIAEKRIAELEATCNKWFEHLKNREEELLNELNNQNAKYNKQIAELEKENAELKEELTKKADTNHSLVEQMADLESENAELKNKLDHRNCVDCSNHGSNIKLLKAKEIIKTLADDLSMYSGNYQKELLEAKQFLEENSISECIRRATHNYMG